ncbi:hypothetical protein WR25_00625 [Diploscapter pachys]|uniref:Uncharacterized protein n=1 Tax=Diploscapter pachys TaxID=2018661 RepID=A0A2A2JTR6_9BILA|nr:hypothetical protein WR25_00625 [Diploscapter pachys]
MGQKEQKPLKRTKRVDEGQIFLMKPSCSCADSLFTISDTECSEINEEQERRRIRDWARRHRRSLHSTSHNVVEHQHLNTSHGHSRYAPPTHSHNQQQIGYGSPVNGNTGHQIRSSFYESPHISHSAHVLGRNAAANGNHSNKVRKLVVDSYS